MSAVTRIAGIGVYVPDRKIDNDHVQLDVIGHYGPLDKTIRTHYLFAERADTVFDFGVASRGPVSLSGNVELEGVNIEVESNAYIDCIDNFHSRGRHLSEKKLPNLLDDIKEIVSPVSQCDPTFRTTELYSPLTAVEVHRRLVEEKGYTHDKLPTVRTISTKFRAPDIT